MRLISADQSCGGQKRVVSNLTYVRTSTLQPVSSVGDSLAYADGYIQQGP